MALTNYCKSQYAPKTDPKIFKHEEGNFVVKMDSKEDGDVVLYSGPHIYFGKTMIVKQWTPNFSFNQEILKVIPIWVKLPTLGVPIYADECTTKQLRISFARILVEMYVTSKVLYEITVEDPNGNVIKQKIVYDWLPPYYAKCQQVGHLCDDQRIGPKVKITQRWTPVKHKPTMAPILSTTSAALEDGIEEREVVRVGLQLQLLFLLLLLM